MKIYTCKYCGKHFEFESSKKAGGFMSAHQRLCDKNPRHEFYIQSLKRGSTTMNKKVVEKQKRLKQKDLESIKVYSFECQKCHKHYQKELTDKEYKSYLKRKHFCSSKCAHSHNMTDEIKIKISKKLTRKEKHCLICNKIIFGKNSKYCSDKCKETAHRRRYSSQEFFEQCQKGGKISASKIKRRSKNEIEFCNLCVKTFNHVENNVPYFNGWDADVLIFDYKIAILWNGPWHYKEIFKSGKQTLKQIQNRDQIKLKEIEKAGWTSYIIKDIEKSKNKVKEEFSTFLNFISNLK